MESSTLPTIPKPSHIWKYLLLVLLMVLIYWIFNKLISGNYKEQIIGFGAMADLSENITKVWFSVFLGFYLAILIKDNDKKDLHVTVPLIFLLIGFPLALGGSYASVCAQDARDKAKGNLEALATTPEPSEDPKVKQRKVPSPLKTIKSQKVLSKKVGSRTPAENKK